MMGIPLHPLFVIPMIVVGGYFQISITNPSKNHKRKILSMTMITYFAFLTLNQIYLFNHWLNFRDDAIYEKCSGPDSVFNGTLEECENSFGTTNEFGSQLFNQCNCSFEETGDEFACVNTDPLYNIEDFLDLIPSEATPYILLGYAFLMILYYFFGCTVPFLPATIPMSTFILGPSFQNKIENDQKTNINEPTGCSSITYICIFC